MASSKIDGQLTAHIALAQGKAMLNNYVRRNRDLPTLEMFSGCWRLILDNPALFEPDADVQNRGNLFSYPWKNLAFARLCLSIQQVRKDLQVEVISHWRGQSIRDVFDPASSILFCGHTRIEQSIGPVVQSARVPLAFLSAMGRFEHQWAYFGVDPIPDLIPAGPQSYFGIRSALARGQAVVMLPEITTLGDPQMRVRQIDPKPILFAQRTKAAVYMFAPELREDATILLHIQRLDIARSVDDVSSELSAFLAAHQNK